MTIIIGRRAIAGDIAGEVARLEALVRDMASIASGHRPGDDELAGAPIIDHWSVALRPLPCLIGGVHGQPNLRGPISATSGLCIFAPDLGWARTVSRYYRLGRPEGIGGRRH